jgi:lactoylglutathione lyase
MKYLHTMIRIKNVEDSLKFFCEGLGLRETRRMEHEKGRFTLIFLAAPNDEKSRN